MKKNISIYLDTELIEKCDELISQKRNRSRSEIFIFALKDYFRKRRV